MNLFVLHQLSNRTTHQARKLIRFRRCRFATSAARRKNARIETIRNIGIIAHIDAGKTTTTERMLYYSQFTRRIGNVDEGSTVTDFLPAERARGITIQSAAITLKWPPEPKDEPQQLIGGEDSSNVHTINLIDTPGHADFTFEVIRSLRILDGAITILDGVAGVEAQTEKVWHQASDYRIPRIIYVNKLDRDGAAFHRSVKEIAAKLHTWPVLCQIPWWQEGKLIGIGDVVNMQALRWDLSVADGSKISNVSYQDLARQDSLFASELRNARVALIEALTEYDEILVEAFLDSNEDWEGLPPTSLVQSLRRLLLDGSQKVTPVFLGASFRNIGVQPLLDAVNQLLPCPHETREPSVSLGSEKTGLRTLLDGSSSAQEGPVLSHLKKPVVKERTSDATISNLAACALAFKVVNDPRRGILVYIRVYSGTISRGALLYNTNLAVSERGLRLLRMYANDAIEVEHLSFGDIGVIAGLKYARTGDTLLVYTGSGAKTGPPPPINNLQLQPIEVPPPLFFASIEPTSLSEEKKMNETLALLLREDPSLSIRIDEESGQTHLAGMGELHLEIARDRLIEDYKVKARMGKIEISYRETITDSSSECTEVFDRDIAGKPSSASCTARVAPIEDGERQSSIPSAIQSRNSTFYDVNLADSNKVTINHPTLYQSGKNVAAEDPALPPHLSLGLVVNALTSGVNAALARGPSYGFPVHSTHISIHFTPAQCLTPSSTPAALTAAARLAAISALKNAAMTSAATLLEPVMVATITTPESAMGDVVHDLNSSRGAQVLSLDAAADDAEGAESQDVAESRLTLAQLEKVYAPPDPFQTASDSNVSASDLGSQQRQIKARVPLKEMVGYLKHLRSLTGGRGTFIMSVDRFEKMSAQRMKATLAEIHGDFV